MRKLVALFVVLFALSCSKSESAAPPVQSMEMPKSMASDEAQSGANASPASPARVAGTGAAMPRMIVRTAEMRIVVSDTTKTVDAVTKTVEAMGGFVSGSNIWREGELLRATLKLRIPADKLTSAVTSIRGLAQRVDTETISSEDVSQEFVDLESQVRNLEATETELRELLTVARANSKKAADVLEVHEQLTIIRGQIEQARGRMRYLSQVTAMSTMNLEILPDAIAQPVVEPGWQPVAIAKNAVRSLVRALQALATIGIWLLIYVLPIVAVFSLVILMFWRIVRRRTRPRTNDEA